MFDNFPVIVKTEKVHGDVFIATRPSLMGMQRDQFALGNGTHKLDAFGGVIPAHFAEIIDEGLLAIGNQRVVLDILVADLFLNSPRWIAQVGHTIKCNRALLVYLKIVAHYFPPVPGI
jgi:hypothetical protein